MANLIPKKKLTPEERSEKAKQAWVTMRAKLEAAKKIVNKFPRLYEYDQVIKMQQKFPDMSFYTANSYIKKSKMKEEVTV